MVLYPVRRRLSTREKLNILFALYGELNDFRHLVEKPTNVARILGYPVQTVFSLYKNFKRDFNLKRLISKVERPDMLRKPIVSENVEKYLIENDTLQKWSHLNLVKRCEIIRKRWNYNVNRETLRLFYKMNNITCRRTYKVFNGESCN